ncbi:MAG: hypothetical protein JST04_01550 [Bdellovibrionales bacterium]|nr:hypothetical protein [Bdellovibrionales bacterium]
MAKWRLNQAPDLIPVPVDPNEYDQVLAGISEILYRAFRQLDSSKKIPERLSTGASVHPRSANPANAQPKTEAA